MKTSQRVKLKEALAAIDAVMLVVAVVAIVTLLVEWGWGATLSPLAHGAILALNALVITFFLFETLAKLFLAPSFGRHIRDNLFEVLLTAAFLVLFFSAEHLYRTAGVYSLLETYGISLAGFYLFLGQVYVLLSVLIKTIAFQKHLSATGIRPAAVVVASFAAVILIGTVLLASPHAVSPGRLVAGEHPTLVDSLFTATSAVCVTGLIVKDTGSYFSTFGQVIILCLIQIGGLGLMTFVTFSSLLIGKGMALREQAVMQDVLSYDVMAKLPRLIVYILLVTLASEVLGTLLLYPVWQGDLSTGRRLYLSVFHAISAFCNAGFCLFSNSFEAYRGSFLLNGVITGLIIFGGLGFIVQRNLGAKLWYALKYRWTPRPIVLKSPETADAPVFLSLQTRIVLVTTGLLLAGGAVLFALLEWSGVLDGMSFKEKVLATWFQTVTPRTAGFNTVDFSLLRTPTHLVTVVLMFIGACPGGTGGGIKTSTFAILIATVYSALRNRSGVEAMRRTISYRTVRQAVMVVLLGVTLVVAGLFVLSVSESGVPFERLLFEEVSAFGTVGLSAGDPVSGLSLSASLSWVGKLVIIATMFTGRIGPLTLVIAIAQRRYAVDYEYPSEQIVIG